MKRDKSHSAYGRKSSDESRYYTYILFYYYYFSVFERSGSVRSREIFCLSGISRPFCLFIIMRLKWCERTSHKKCLLIIHDPHTYAIFFKNIKKLIISRKKIVFLSNWLLFVALNVASKYVFRVNIVIGLIENQKKKLLSTPREAESTLYNYILADQLLFVCLCQYFH